VPISPSMPAATMAAICAISAGSGGSADSPSPGRSGAITRRVGLKAGTVWIQCCQEPAPPWSRMSAGPLPQLRQAMLPSPHGDSVRCANSSSCRTGPIAF
jgi:hypothetical protein